MAPIRTWIRPQPVPEDRGKPSEQALFANRRLQSKRHEVPKGCIAGELATSSWLRHARSRLLDLRMYRQTVDKAKGPVTCALLFWGSPAKKVRMHFH